MNEEMTSCIEEPKSPQRGICRRLRSTVIAPIPGIHEQTKLGVPWYEGKCYILSLTDHVNLSVKGSSQHQARMLRGTGRR